MGFLRSKRSDSEPYLKKKRCAQCNFEKPRKAFRTKTSLTRTLRSICNICDNLRLNANRKRSRASGLDRARWILTDSKHSDKRNGRTCDLTKEIIEALIVTGCAYCGDTNTMIGLDRKDNSKGHTVDNVTPACTRCNMIRRDMPLDAWLLLVPMIRLARAQGLFRDWVGGRQRTCPRRKRNLG